MFSGIVGGTCPVRSLEQSRNAYSLTLDLGHFKDDLEIGASVAVNGVCLTAVAIGSTSVSFDVVAATISTTNLGSLEVGSHVNVERSLRVGDEIGGHILSGHICGTVQVVELNTEPHNRGMSFLILPDWTRYFVPKGFIALNGVSLTLAEIDQESRIGHVNLIPETLRQTNLGEVEVGDKLNLEVDPMTQMIVQTVDSYLQNHL